MCVLFLGGLILALFGPPSILQGCGVCVCVYFLPMRLEMHMPAALCLPALNFQ